MATNNTKSGNSFTAAEKKAVQELQQRKKMAKGKEPVCGWPTEEEVIQQARIASAQKK